MDTKTFTKQQAVAFAGISTAANDKRARERREMD
jgi:hypothetical protein